MTPEAKAAAEKADMYAGSATLFLLPLLFAWEGVAFSRAWTWFVVPFGIRPIGVAHAAGLCILLGFVAHTARRKKVRSTTVLSHAIFAPAMLLGGGWTIHWFMVAGDRAAAVAFALGGAGLLGALAVLAVFLAGGFR